MTASSFELGTCPPLFISTLKNSQLRCYIIINFIFKAVFFIKAKGNISLYGAAFCYGFENFNKFAFEILGILVCSVLQRAD